MTQEVALAQYRAMFPDKAENLTVERDRKIGFRESNTYYLWDYSDPVKASLISSSISWEAVLAEARLLIHPSGGWPDEAEDVQAEAVEA